MISVWGQNITFEFNKELQIFYLCNTFTLPISGFAGYLIINKSPTEMKEYRYFLLNIWVWTALSDLVLTLILQIQLFFPLFGGASCSTFVNYLMPTLPDNGYSAWVLAVWVLVNNSISLLNGFFYRLWVLETDSWLTRKPKRIFYVCGGIHVIKSSIETGECILAYTPRTQMEMFILEHFPEHASVLSIPNFLLMEPSLNPWNAYMFITFTFGNCCIFSIVTYIIIRIFQILKISRHIMSDRTYQQHRMLTISLIWQAVLPLFVFYLPTTLGMGYLLFNRSNSPLIPVISNIFLVLLCFHTNLNLISMIYFIKPYRIAVWKIVAKIRRIEHHDSSTIVVSSHPSPHLSSPSRSHQRNSNTTSNAQPSASLM